MRNQMKKVSGSNIPTTSTTGASTLTATGGVAMLRTGSGGSGGLHTVFVLRISADDVVAGRTTSALSGQRRESPSLRGGEPSVIGMCITQDYLRTIPDTDADCS